MVGNGVNCFPSQVLFSDRLGSKFNTLGINFDILGSDFNRWGKRSVFGSSPGGWGRALAFSLGMARVVSPGLFAWGWGLAPTPRQSAHYNERSPGAAISPVSEAYTSICRIHPCSGLRRLPYASNFETQGSFRGKGAEPL